MAKVLYDTGDKNDMCDKNDTSDKISDHLFSVIEHREKIRSRGVTNRVAIQNVIFLQNIPSHNQIFHIGSKTDKRVEIFDLQILCFKF